MGCILVGGIIRATWVMRTQVHTFSSIAYSVVREVTVLGAPQHPRPTAYPIPVHLRYCGPSLPLVGKVVNAVMRMELTGEHHNRDSGEGTAPRLRSTFGFELNM